MLFRKKLDVSKLLNVNPVEEFSTKISSMKAAPLLDSKFSQEFDLKSCNALWNIMLDIVEFWIPFNCPDSEIMNVLLYKTTFIVSIDLVTLEDSNDFEIVV